MKSEHCRLGMVLFFCLLTFVMGLLIFTKGFLLIRTTIQRNSSCTVDFATHDDHVLAFDGCWMHARFKRAVIIIVDALKYDFLAYDSSYTGDDVPYKNKFRTVHSLVNRQPYNARLYKFIADPPTTTLQRLKGLTTGSLPTFVDAGSNFASSEIVEDNIIDQLVRQNKKITFMGDDTWERLFPGRFQKSFSFPSFNVKDLNTVDDGILKFLPSELEQMDWDVIIAHFLGVDHCGHRFGPNHPAMAEKLTQMDQMIRNVTRQLGEDTVLFVLGDHGMTVTGDHGGDSEDELTAGLFIYSPAKITLSQPVQGMVTQQTDFVPTLSLLLGIPIPFSSLGSLITDLFNHCPWWETKDNPVRQVFHTVKALHLTAQQMSRYISEYAGVSSDLPESTFHSVTVLLKKADSELQALMTSVASGDPTKDVLSRLQHLQVQYQTYLTRVRQMCQDVWARFDMTSMLVGILTMTIAALTVLALLMNLRKDTDQTPHFAYVVIVGSAVHVVYYILHTLLLTQTVLPLLSLALVLTLLLYLSITLSKKVIEVSKQLTWSDRTDDFVAMTIVCLCCLIYFSNSFVVHEDVTQHFLAQSLLWYIAFRTMLGFIKASDPNAKRPLTKIVRKGKTSSLVDILEILTQPAAVTFFVTCVCSVLLRLTTFFRSCREEQWACKPSVLLAPPSTTGEATRYKNQQYFFSAGCLLATLWLIRKWMQHYGSLNGDRLNVLSMKFIMPLGGMCCTLYWAVQGLPQKELDALAGWQQCLMAQLVYACVIVHMIIVLAQPVFVYIWHPSPANTISVPPSSRGIQFAIPFVYRHLRENWNSRDEEDRTTAAYGLGSVYSCSVWALGAGVFLLLVLLLGEEASPGLCLALIIMFFFLELVSTYGTSNKGDKQTPISLLAVAGHGVLSSTFFFATGHQATIPSIRFESAFTGFHGDFSSNILPAALIALNTFAAPLLFTVLSPLLLFWKYLEGPVKRWTSVPQGASISKWKGDFHLYDDGILLRKNLLISFTRMLFFSSAKVLAAACAAVIHRRHLMVWKIFAPRFIFEAAAMLVTSVVLVLMYLFVLHVDHMITRLVKSLEDQERQH